MTSSRDVIDALAYAYRQAQTGNFVVPQFLGRRIAHTFQIRSIRLRFKSEVCRIAARRVEGAMQRMWVEKADKLYKEAESYDIDDVPNTVQFVDSEGQDEI